MRIKNTMALLDYLRFSLLLALLAGILLGIGYYFAGPFGLTLALLFAIAMNFFAYFYSDKVVLAMYHAKPLANKEIDEIVEELSKEARIPKPKLYLVMEEQPNAFATGRSQKHSAIAVTSGLLKVLNREEIAGVLSHEIAHIKNRDILISSVVATLAGAISYLAEMLWWSSLFGGEGEDDKNLLFALPVIILAPIAALLIQLAISRGREFLADETGAKISKKPLALASALRKIAGYAREMPFSSGSKATSHLWIVNPFSQDFLARLFSTHPPIEERIKRLEKIA